MKPATPIAVWAGALTLVLAWGGVSSLWAQDAPAQKPKPGANAGGHEAYAPHHRFERRPRNAEIQIYMNPETEHWPSNYVPDNYRLDGYDGEPDRATVCRGDGGATYATRTIECPAGQQQSQPGRTWSTSP